MDLATILEDISHSTHSRKGCVHCGCYLSVCREQATTFHVKQAGGEIVFVEVYRGKLYCKACHRFQAS